jgi:hypothetical protein
VLRKTSFTLLVAFVWVVCTGAGTGGAITFDAAALPSALPDLEKADDATVVIALQGLLPPHMSVVSDGHLVIAASGSMQDTMRQGRRLADYEAHMRRRSFPGLEPRPTVVILGENTPALQRLAKTLYPALSESEIASSGFYHPRDRLILVTTGNGFGAVLHLLMLALVRDDNPNAPHWFEQAAATLYESSEWRGKRLMPVLDQRMKLIAPDEDLSYDVFAGICDCSPVSAEQLALMRLLLVYFEQRDELIDLHAAIKKQGQYTTLLQALETMDFDGTAWKKFAEHSVRMQTYD